jgi:hypothetical protein
MKAGSSAKLEGKIVLSLAARLLVEKFMVDKINDAKKVDAIVANQTTKLLTLYQACTKVRPCRRASDPARCAHDTRKHSS